MDHDVNRTGAPLRAVVDRRNIIFSSLALAAFGCAPESPPIDPAVRRVLAPSGKFRAGLYPGTPTSIIPQPGGADPRGVGHDLGRAFARHLGVPFEPVVYDRNEEVLAAVRSGAVDVCFTNATAERARVIDFTQPFMDVELGYLVHRTSPIKTISDIDSAGMRIGVTENSSSDGRLTREFKVARVVRARTLKDGVALLAQGHIEAYATNKAALFEMGDQLPGSRVLDGRWGVERYALGLPKGRDAGMPEARRFIDAVIQSGKVKEAIDRAGLRGAVVAR